MMTGRPAVRGGPDGGASFLQYLALGVLAAVILGALVALGVGGTLAGGAGQVVCRVVHRGTAAKDCPAGSGKRPVAEPPAGGGRRTDHTGRPHPTKPREKKQDCGFLGLKCLGRGGQKRDTGGRHGGGCGFLAYKCAGPAAIAVLGYGGGQLASTLGGLGHFFGDPFAAARNAAHGEPPWGTGLPKVPGKGHGLTRDDIAKIVGVATKLTPNLPPYSWLRKLTREPRFGSPGDDAAMSRAEHTLEKARADHDFSVADAQRVLNEYLKLSPADKTRFLDELSMGELSELYGRAPPPPSNARSDLMQYASPKALAGMRVPEPAFKGSGTFRPFHGDLWRAGGPKATDGTQGVIGNCYCVASSKAVALEDPRSTMSRFRRNPNGTITYTFGDGERVTFKATLPGNGSSVKTDAGWPALEEKAIAIRAGGYDAIAHGGTPDVPLRWLTGHSSARYQGSRNMPGLGDIASYQRHGDAMVLGIEKGAKIPDAARRGLMDEHAYTVIGADPGRHEIHLLEPNTNKVITMTEDEISGNGRVWLFRSPTG